MKKQISLVLIGVMALSLVACGSSETAIEVSNTSNTDTSSTLDESLEDVRENISEEIEEENEGETEIVDDTLAPEVIWDDMDALPIIDHTFDLSDEHNQNVFLQYDIDYNDVGPYVDILSDGTIQPCEDLDYMGDFTELHEAKSDVAYHIRLKDDYYTYEVKYVKRDLLTTISEDLIYKNGVDNTAQYKDMTYEEATNLFGHGTLCSFSNHSFVYLYAIDDGEYLRVVFNKDEKGDIILSHISILDSYMYI